MFAVLVLPLVPVTKMTGPLNFNFVNIFLSTLQPIEPGIDPPLPIRCNPQALSFVDNIDKVFIEISFSILLYYTTIEVEFKN